MLSPVNLLVLAIAAEACIDNLLWKDIFGWTCRDYTRDPRECRSNYALSDEGIKAEEACCACVITVERRRDVTCDSTCVSQEEACTEQCTSERTICNYYCDLDEDSVDGVSEAGDSEEQVVVTRVKQTLEWWGILLIVLAILLCLCATCVALYLMCMTQNEGECEDDECATQQPMLVEGGCGVPNDNPCGNSCENPGPQIAYNHSSGYSQGQMW